MHNYIKMYYHFTKSRYQSTLSQDQSAMFDPIPYSIAYRILYPIPYLISYSNPYLIPYPIPYLNPITYPVSIHQQKQCCHSIDFLFKSMLSFRKFQGKKVPISYPILIIFPI